MRPIAILVVLALAVAACGGDSGDSTTTLETGGNSTTQPSPDEGTTAIPAPTTTAGPGSTAPAAEDGLSTGDTILGQVLVDDSGRTLYAFFADADGESSCYDSCADNWPAVPASLTAGAGVDVELGSHSRTDGTEQLTVNGRPVYLFAGDSAPGDVNGQGIGDVWFAVGGDGEPITE